MAVKSLGLVIGDRATNEIILLLRGFSAGREPSMPKPLFYRFAPHIFTFCDKTQSDLQYTLFIPPRRCCRYRLLPPLGQQHTML